MKNIILFLFTSCLLLSCKKIKYSDTATILGPDLRMCACCGGYYIQIDNNSNTYALESVPSNSGIDLNKTSFPIHVELNWSQLPKCNGRFIESSQMHKIP